MTRKVALPLFTAMMLLTLGGSAATAQSVGNTDPAFANTRDPNSAPGVSRRGLRTRAETYSAYRHSDIYARGHWYHHRRVAARAPAAKPDPAIAAQRDTALFMRDAMNPYGATATTGATRP